MYSYGPPHMAVQKQDDQHEHTFSNYVRIQDVVQKTCLRRWTIGKSGERGSGLSVLPEQHDDDDDYCNPIIIFITHVLSQITIGYIIFSQHFINLLLYCSPKPFNTYNTIIVQLSILYCNRIYSYLLIFIVILVYHTILGVTSEYA